jgi:hypothetical protein
MYLSIPDGTLLYSTLQFGPVTPVPDSESPSLVRPDSELHNFKFQNSRSDARAYSFPYESTSVDVSG